MLKLIMLNWSYWFFFDLFLVPGSSVLILSIKLSLFLVSIFDVDGSIGWLGWFDSFKRSREDDVGVWSLLDCGECSALIFGSGFDVWFFLRLSILEVGGRCCRKNFKLLSGTVIFWLFWSRTHIFDQWEYFMPFCPGHFPGQL